MKKTGGFKKRAAIAVLALLSTGVINSQSKGSISSGQFKVSGNCEMCKKTIEEAAAIKGVRKAEWNKETQILSVEYNGAVTEPREVLRKVAYAGYDNEQYLAPDKAYEALKTCCRYERTATSIRASNFTERPTSEKMNAAVPDQEKEDSLVKVYESYFLIKDALVKGDAASASQAATIMLNRLNNIEMNKMKKNEHEMFMKLQKQWTEQASTIALTKKIEKQRKIFSALSETTYRMMKTKQPPYEVFVDHCPMYGNGANWLSKEKQIKNPYYGSSMLSCGKVTETIR